MNRADHFMAADELVWSVRRRIAALGPAQLEEQCEELALLLGAAEVHASLAGCGPGVEAEVGDIEKRNARALGAAESPQAARPPLPARCRCGGTAGRPFDREHSQGSPECAYTVDGHRRTPARPAPPDGPGAATKSTVERVADALAGLDRPKPRPPGTRLDCYCAAGQPYPHPRGSQGCRWAQ